MVQQTHGRASSSGPPEVLVVMDHWTSRNSKALYQHGWMVQVRYKCSDQGGVGQSVLEGL